MCQRKVQVKNLSVMHSRTGYPSLLCMALLVVGLLITACSGRPLLRTPEPETVGRSRQQRFSDLDGNYSEGGNDVDPFGDIPTSDDSEIDPFGGLVNYTDPPSVPGCFVEKEETRSYITKVDGKDVTRNMTLITRDCCDGYTGVECNEKVPPPKPDVLLDESDPCNGLVCVGNERAFCAVVSKCGRNYPLFMTLDGQLAECDNDQPTDLNSIVCTAMCPENPCAGQTCPGSPDAQCLTSGCDCKPLWILPSGVQVDCVSGEHVSPDAEREKRQAETSNCST